MANRLFAGLVALTFVLAPGAPAFAKVRTVRGQLVDKVCYYDLKMIKKAPATARRD